MGRGVGGRLIKECREVRWGREDVRDEGVAKGLWEGSERLIERVEREEAVKRAVVKKEKEEKEKSEKGSEAKKEEGVKKNEGGKSRRQRKGK